MAEQIFAYITHKAGKADDSALELATAAGKIYPDASTTAIVTGSGANLDTVCSEMANSYREVWKFDHEAGIPQCGSHPQTAGCRFPQMPFFCFP